MAERDETVVDRVERVAAALRSHKIEAIIVESGEEGFARPGARRGLAARRWRDSAGGRDPVPGPDDEFHV